MMEKRNRQWRRKQCYRVFKNRVKKQSAWTDVLLTDDGLFVYRPSWSELAKCKWVKVYKTTGTPCSCPMCRGERYKRVDSKRETRRILFELMGEVHD